MTIAFRHSAGFGKRIEYWVVGLMLKEGLDVYLPLVDDDAIDAIIKRPDGTFIEVQIKARSKMVRFGDAALFAAITDKSRPSYWFVFYSERLDKIWVMSSAEFIEEAVQNKSGANVGKEACGSTVLESTKELAFAESMQKSDTRNMSPEILEGCCLQKAANKSLQKRFTGCVSDLRPSSGGLLLREKYYAGSERLPDVSACQLALSSAVRLRVRLPDRSGSGFVRVAAVFGGSTDRLSALWSRGGNEGRLIPPEHRGCGIPAAQFGQGAAVQDLHRPAFLAENPRHLFLRVVGRHLIYHDPVPTDQQYRYLFDLSRYGLAANSTQWVC